MWHPVRWSRNREGEVLGQAENYGGNETIRAAADDTVWRQWRRQDMRRERQAGGQNGRRSCRRTGDDYLEGGYGSDTYVYNKGDGHDTIDNSTYHHDDKERTVWKFGEGITLERYRGRGRRGRSR